jgi:hypothetical protein
LQTLEEEKQKLQDPLICHEELHIGIFHELERKLWTKNQVLAPLASIHEDWLVENVKSLMKKGLSPLKCMMIKKDDSSYYCFSRQYGECSEKTEEKRTSDEEVLNKKLGLPSIPRKGIRSETSPGKYVHYK